MPTDHLAVLEELKARLNAIEFDVACGSLSAAQTFTKVRDAHAAAIALMRGQSEPVADAAAGKDAFLALADSLDCFWNASLGATHPYDDATANAVMSGMVQGFAAVAFRLREHAANKTEGPSR